jgi:hypothetical protein
MLQNPLVRSWLGGVEPAWTLLDEPSFAALQRPPSPSFGPIRLASDFTPAELQQSAVARNVLILLQAAATGPGLKTTATGNLSRAVVAKMHDRFIWPEYDKTIDFEINRVINEPDFLPLYFVRHAAQAGKMLRKYKGHIKITPAGRLMLEQPNLQTLQAVLFHIAMWFLDIRYPYRGPYYGWPQCDAGIVLWSLSIAANDWQSRERLTRLCTIPIESVLGTPWDSASSAMEAQILWPLIWFGLIDHRVEIIDPARFEKRHFYRKTALFDRFLSFDVRLEGAEASRH